MRLASDHVGGAGELARYLRFWILQSFGKVYPERPVVSVVEPSRTGSGQVSVGGGHGPPYINFGLRLLQCGEDFGIVIKSAIQST